MAHELTLNRLLDAPADKLYRLWTDLTAGNLAGWLPPFVLAPDRGLSLR